MIGADSVAGVRSVGWRSIGASIALLVGVLLGIAPSTPARAGGGGLEHLGTRRVSERLQVARFQGPALVEEARVTVLLPDHNNPSGATRYPMLYLLHGAGGNANTRLADGDAEKATAGVPFIVVMPDGGFSGYYSDWWNCGGSRDRSTTFQ